MKSKSLLLFAAIVMVLAIFTLLNFSDLELLIQTPIADVDINQIIDISAINYTPQIDAIPKEIVQSFLSNKWNLQFEDMQHEVAPDHLYAGMIDYQIKTIYIRDTNKIAHEFGHYLNYQLNNKEDVNALYKAESHAVIDVLGKYAMKNHREFFASYFDYWINNQNNDDALLRLQECSPMTYEYFTNLSQNSWGLNTSVVVLKF